MLLLYPFLVLFQIVMAARALICVALFDPTVYAGTILCGAIAVMTSGFHDFNVLHAEWWRWPIAVVLASVAFTILHKWSNQLKRANLNYVAHRLADEVVARDDLNYWLGEFKKQKNRKR